MRVVSAVTKRRGRGQKHGCKERRDAESNPSRQAVQADKRRAETHPLVTRVSPSKQRVGPYADDDLFFPPFFVAVLFFAAAPPSAAPLYDAFVLSSGYRKHAASSSAPAPLCTAPQIPPPAFSPVFAAFCIASIFRWVMSPCHTRTTPLIAALGAKMDPPVAESVYGAAGSDISAKFPQNHCAGLYLWVCASVCACVRARGVWCGCVRAHTCAGVCARATRASAAQSPRDKTIQFDAR